LGILRINRRGWRYKKTTENPIGKHFFTKPQNKLHFYQKCKEMSFFFSNIDAKFKKQHNVSNKINKN